MVLKAFKVLMFVVSFMEKKDNVFFNKLRGALA